MSTPMQRGHHSIFAAHSRTVQVENLVFTPATQGVRPDTGEFIGPDVEAQTKQALRLLQDTLKRSGSSLWQVIGLYVVVQDSEDWVKVKQVLGTFFGDDMAGRISVHTGDLPEGARVELEAVAKVSGPAASRSAAAQCNSENYYG